ncbi:uncharacterized protein LOC129218727 [Uloborus diversus]|uniref:uncharacterized protein LOC129218727 n=1 Tax=Uloborus diversus TaxID=327109 RepID=UPI00240A259A|nr:uncharacterized protein LOC129218727 [Uloborus diversus]
MSTDKEIPKQSVSTDVLSETESTEQACFVGHVGVKVPPFWKPDPRIWFLQLEAQFRRAKITSDETKFDLVVSSIEAEILAQVTDILVTPPPNNKYYAIKDRLISTFADSESQRTQKLLTQIELGDRKPSILLCEMRNLADQKVSENFLKTLFLQRLPMDMRSILSVSNDDLNKLATMADKIWDLRSPNNYNLASVSHTNVSMVTLESLQKQITDLRILVENLNKRGRSSARRQHSGKSHSKSDSRKPSDQHGICYFHSKFGDKAYKCLQPCSMSLQLRREGPDVQEN